MDGELVAVNPPSEAHAKIEASICRALDRRLPPPCRAYFSGGAWRSEPDIFVACVDGEGFARQPRLAAEVLSPSTEKDDRTGKLDFYRRFESVQTVALVWQDTRRVELHERTGEDWLLRRVMAAGAWS